MHRSTSRTTTGTPDRFYCDNGYGWSNEGYGAINPYGHAACPLQLPRQNNPSAIDQERCGRWPSALMTGTGPFCPSLQRTTAAYQAGWGTQAGYPRHATGQGFFLTSVYSLK